MLLTYIFDENQKNHCKGFTHSLMYSCIYQKPKVTLFTVEAFNILVCIVYLKMIAMTFLHSRLIILENMVLQRVYFAFFIIVPN